jgi:ketosteroid isomerase-like protein
MTNAHTRFSVGDESALVRRYYDVVDAGDNAALIALFDQDATYKRPGYAQFNGHEDLRNFYENNRVIVSGAHTLTALFVDGLRVAVEGTFAGTLKDGRKVTLPFSDFFELHPVDGELKILRRRTYFDDVQV